MEQTAVYQTPQIVGLANKFRVRNPFGEKTTTVCVATVHVDHDAAKKRDIIMEALRDLKLWLQQQQVDVLHGDFNQVLYKRAFRRQMRLSRSYSEGKDADCVGFLLFTSHWTTHAHGSFLYYLAAVGLRPSGKSAHCPSFIHLRPTEVSASFRHNRQRDRSEQPVQTLARTSTQEQPEPIHTAQTLEDVAAVRAEKEELYRLGRMWASMAIAEADRVAQASGHQPQQLWINKFSQAQLQAIAESATMAVLMSPGHHRHVHYLRDP